MICCGSTALRLCGVERKGRRKVKIVDATTGAGGFGPRRGRSEHGAANGRPVPLKPAYGGIEGELYYGALDLGTNNCRLLIAVPAQTGFTVVDAFSRIVRLGEGLSHTGRLGEPAMLRTIEALRVCANKLAWRKVGRTRLVATEACRTAENGAQFIRRVQEETGLVLEIIDRETEAHLAATGAEPLIEQGADTTMIFDIGGGSTELMWIVRHGNTYRVAAWTSLAAGVVTLSERFGGVLVSPQIFAAMRDHLRPMLKGFVDQVKAANGGNGMPDHLLGTSGTVTTIAGVQLGLKRYDRSRVDGCWLESDAIGDVTAKLLAMDYAARSENPCIGRERADLVLAGCAILEEIRLAFPTPRIRVADRGLREGMLTLLMREDNAHGIVA
ncbi:MAG: Ppx/GppA family phosphatase [Rhizobiales bacterium]|nr:Ppx/GppA family phosphatase [Hyphomicrobiales bacterium]